MTPSFYVGAISGTSVDGLDLALLDTSPKLQIEAAITVELPTDLRAELIALAAPDIDEIVRTGQADRRLGQFIGTSINEMLSQWLPPRAIPPEAVLGIGSHGQTIRHHPSGPYPFTVQIGDPSTIAEITGITTVADFRRRDIAAGGQGAPLVPPFHEALFADREREIALLNLGGIANLSRISTRTTLSGYDTGPANALLDAWCQRHQGQPFDRNGAWGATGTISESLLSELLREPYLNKPPPKSTGKELFNLAWLDARLESRKTLAPADVQATLTEFTAISIARALHRWSAGAEILLLCGGGRHNLLLRQRLEAHCGLNIASTDEEGIDGDGLEAAAFAWLAYRTLSGLSGNNPGVTGASGYRPLGGIYLGNLATRPLVEW